MKKVKAARSFFLLIALLSYVAGFAQSDYVITTKNDTIRGKVKFLNFGSSKNIQVTTAQGKKSTYSIIQIKVAYMGDETYVPVRHERTYELMKVIKAGYLNMYAFQNANQVGWDGRYLLTMDNRGLELPNLGFRKIMIKYLTGCPTLTKRIESNELTKSDIDEIVDQYNACINASSKQAAQSQEPVVVKKTTWDNLENTVAQLEDFGSKNNCLDMIKDIKSKINRKEAIPEYILDALTNALKDQAYASELLKQAIQETKL